LDFNAYMIKPVQRICKYPLLLRELISKTDPGNEDYPKLQEAFTKIEGIVNTINEKKRESEQNNKVYEIANSIINAEGHEIISPTRRFIKEGELSHYANGKLKPGYFFLFNDLFLYTKKKSKQYILKAFALLANSEIRFVSTYEKPTFELICSEGETKVWPLAFDTEDEKFKFIEELQELIDKMASMLARRRNSGYSPGINKPSLLRISQGAEYVTFECEYYDRRTVEIPRNNLSFDMLYWSILQQFQVEACTIVNGERFVDSQQELDNMLSDAGSFYNLLIYDPYS